MGSLRSQLWVHGNPRQWTGFKCGFTSTDCILQKKGPPSLSTHLPEFESLELFPFLSFYSCDYLFQFLPTDPSSYSRLSKGIVPTHDPEVSTCTPVGRALYPSSSYWHNLYKCLPVYNLIVHGFWWVGGSRVSFGGFGPGSTELGDWFLVNVIPIKTK